MSAEPDAVTAAWLDLAERAAGRSPTVRADLQAFRAAATASPEPGAARPRPPLAQAVRLLRSLGGASPDAVVAQVTAEGEPDAIWPLVLQSAALLGAGWVTEALVRMERASELLQAAPDDAVLVAFQPILAMAYTHIGDLPRAVNAWRDQAEFAKRIGDRSLEGVAIGNLGFLHGEHDQAEPYEFYTREALAIFRELGQTRLIAHGYCNLGGALTRSGRLTEAREAYGAGFPLALSLDWPWGHALYHAGLGGLAIAEGAIDAGFASYERSIQILEDAGDPFQVCRHQLMVGGHQVALGLHDEAIETLQRCIQRSREGGYRVNLWQASEHLSRALEAKGDLAGALAALREHLSVRGAENEARLAERVRAAEARIQAETQRREVAFERQRAAAFEQLNAELNAALDAQRALQVQLTAAARTDPLTGLSNRRHQQATLAASGAAAALAVVLIDLDAFKAVNDTYGHAVGDEVLVAVAQRLSAGVRSTDTLSRWGGEEFCLTMADCTEATAVASAERLLHRLSATPIPTSAGPLRITASIGVAAAQESPFDRLLNQADLALYHAKRSGRALVVAASTLPETPTPDAAEP
jgi:two-component system cell cycle response regulator